MRKIILPLIALACLLLPAQADAGPLRRIVGGVARIAAVPARVVAPARVQARRAARQQRVGRLGGC